MAESLDWRDFPVLEISEGRFFVPEKEGGFPHEKWRRAERLWIQGSPEAHSCLDLLPGRGLAIVGTRQPERSTERDVREAVAALRGSGLVIVSGLARGVDAAAHEAALEAELPTIAVVAGGWDVCYPREHEELRTRILRAGGLVITEQGPGEPPYESCFLERNRWIAALSKTIWVAQAPVRSGALNTAKWARDLGRVVLATPSRPGDPAFLGNQDLMDRHEAQCFWGAHSLSSVWLELLSLKPQVSSGKGKKRKNSDSVPRSLSIRAQALWKRVANDEHSLGASELQDLLAWAMGKEGWMAGDFFAALTELESRNHVLRRGGSLKLRREIDQIRSGT